MVLTLFSSTTRIGVSALVVFLCGCAGLSNVARRSGPDNWHTSPPIKSSPAPAVANPGSLPGFPPPSGGSPLRGASSFTLNAASLVGQTANNRDGVTPNSRVIVPAGEDEVAWAIFAQSGLLTDRPVDLSIEVTSAPLVPGGEDDLPLSYWIGLSNHSQGHWEWYGPFDAPQALQINSDTLRERYVSLAGNFALVVLCDPRIVDPSPTNPTGLCAVEVQGISANTLNITEPGYFITKPLPPSIAVDLQDVHDGSIRIGLSGVTDADSYELYRRLKSGSWELIGSVDTPSVEYIDPTDNDGGVSNVLQGEEYEYRAFSIANGPPQMTSLPSEIGTCTTPGNLIPVARLDSDVQSGQAPLSVNFDASTSSDADGSIANYQWDFDGDGLFSNSLEEQAAQDNPTPAAYTYLTEGTYDAAVFVGDNAGALSETVIRTIVVNPIGTFNVVGSVLLPDGTTGLADVLVEVDASHNDYTLAAGSYIIAAVPNGPYTVTPSLNGWSFDPQDYSGTGSDADEVGKNFTAYSVPFASFTQSPESGNAPLSVDFDASASHDEDDGTGSGQGIAAYEWDWDYDGSTFTVDQSSASPMVSHSYLSGGSFTPALRVVDGDGGQGLPSGDQTSAVVTVGPIDVNTPPVADLNASPTEGNAPLDVNFDASGSSDPDGTITDYEWDFDGDGTYNEVGAETNARGNPTPAAYTYNNPGSYSAKVRVSDNAAPPATDVATALVSVNFPPTADLTADPASGYAPLSVAFDASGSSDSDGTIVNYEWDFDGDGTFGETGDELDAQGNPTPASYIFGSPGIFDSKVRVTDDGGASSTVSVQITANSHQGDWCMWGHDSRHTRQSIFTGPLTHPEQWSFPTLGPIMSAPALADDGTIYVGSNDDSLYAINPDGSQKWTFPTGGDVASSPAIGIDGTIYVGSLSSKLFAINPDGTQKWTYSTNSTISEAPTIGEDGTIYVGDLGNTVYAVHPDGSERWVYSNGNDMTSPAIAGNGAVYVGNYNGTLYALTSSGSLDWQYVTGGPIAGAPAIGADGTIYVGSYDNNLYALNPDGSFKWSFPTGGDVASSPAVASDGTIYAMSFDHFLYAINPDGSQKWAFPGGGSGGGWSCSMAIGADGTVYAGLFNNTFDAIKPDGTSRWSHSFGTDVGNSAAIGSDGTLYIPNQNKSLYAIGPGS